MGQKNPIKTEFIEYGVKRINDTLEGKEFAHLSERSIKMLRGATNDFLAEVLADNTDITKKALVEFLDDQLLSRMVEAAKQLDFEEKKEKLVENTYKEYDYEVVYDKYEEGIVLADKKGAILKSADFDSVQKSFYTPTIKYLLDTYAKGLKIEGDKLSEDANEELVDVLTNLGFYVLAAETTKITEEVDIDSVVGWRVVEDFTVTDGATSSIKIITVSKIKGEDKPASIDTLTLTLGQAIALKTHFEKVGK